MGEAIDRCIQTCMQFNFCSCCNNILIAKVVNRDDVKREKPEISNNSANFIQF